MLKKINEMTIEEIKEKSSAIINVVKDKNTLAANFAETVMNFIKEQNKKGERSVIIMPVGPTGEWKLMVELAINENIDLSNLCIVSMDEYLLEDGVTSVPESNPFSFRAFIKENFANIAIEKCNFKEENWAFPNTSDMKLVERKIEEWGGVDIAFGGIGLNGHIAFNEAPEASECWTNDTFSDSSVRVLKVSEVTKATNSIFGTGGDLTILPSYAITIGLKQILEARQIHIFLDWIWQRNVLRRTLLGPIGMQFPASYIQSHNNVKVTITEEVAEVHSLIPE